MIKRLEEDRDKEFEEIRDSLCDIEKDISILDEYSNISNSYLDTLKWKLYHIPNDKNSIRKLNSINSKLLQHIKGFKILIENQNSLDLKKEMIKGFLITFQNNYNDLQNLYEE